jgi:FdhE protein
MPWAKVKGKRKMAGGFIHKLFGQPPVSSPEVKQALDDLGRLAQERPHLAGSAALLGDVLPKLALEPIHDSPPALAVDHATAKLGGGLPLLRGEPFDFDVDAFRRRWLEICSSVDRHQGGDAGRHMARALRQEQLTPQEMTREVLSGHPQTIHARAQELNLDAGLTGTVLRLTLFPLLVQINVVLTPLRESTRWQQGYCPTCGSWPALGEFRGLEQTRYLRCGLCAAQWEYPRLGCPFCGTSDHQVLGYFHVEGEEAKYRASTCDECRGYVKMVTTLFGLTPPGLLVAELATMHLDLAAAERGYMPPP